MRRTGDLDAKDREILALLEADARRSVSEIGRLTGLSPPTVTERIARLTPDEFLELVAAVIGVNRDFFARRMNPDLLARVAHLAGLRTGTK